jgi:hypothetical protein
VKWNEKTGGQIYDFLIYKTGFVSKSGYGILGNRVIKELKTKNFLPESCDKNLAKK